MLIANTPHLLRGLMIPQPPNWLCHPTAVFPTISSTFQLCRAGMGPVQDPFLYPPSVLPWLLCRAWQHAALCVSPSFPLFLPSVLCLFDFSLFWLFPSIISLLACHCLSFFMCVYRDFHPFPQPFLSLYFHHPLPLPSVQCYPAPSLSLPSCN